MTVKKFANLFATYLLLLTFYDEVNFGSAQIYAVTIL